MSGPVIFATALMMLTEPDGVRIDVNPADIVGLRPSRGGPHITHRANCMLVTVDGKFISVIETCDEVRKRIGEAEKPY